LAEAERSFNEVRRIDPQNAEALNDTGVALLRRNQSREAATYFESALRQRPEYPAALLNLAAVLQEHLNNRKLALEKYNQYLALNPRPANWDAVSLTAKELEERLNPPQPHPTPTTNVARAQTNTTVRVATNIPKQEATPKPAAPKPKPTPEPEVVQVSRTPAIKVAEAKPPPTNDAPQPAVDLPGPLLTERVVVSPSSDSDETNKPQKRGFFQKLNPMNLFRHEPKDANIPGPLPKSPVSADEMKPVQVAATTESAPVRPAQPPKPLNVPRYPYKSPSKPPPGNRQEANRLLAQGIQAYRDHRLKDALAAYHGAVGADPSSFEAQSDLGLAAFDSDDLPDALSAYEVALAINPVSFNARFNFALALKKAGYIQDAALELERLLAISPANETPEHLAMAHLALGNLYSEEFHQPDAARPHYQKVLELDPQNSQATAIRYWLRDNS
jgi:tetratricopeptide (TPR) repeat protein